MTTNNLLDRIRTGVQQGVVPNPWTTADLIRVRDPFFAEWSEGTLRAVPWSHSESLCGEHRGDKVTRSGVSPYVRVDRHGKSWRYCLREHAASIEPLPAPVKVSRFKQARGTVQVPPRARLVSPPRLADRNAFASAYRPVILDIYHYVASTPLLKRQGWRDQLKHYQWGSKESTWLDGVSSRQDNAARVAAYREGQAPHQEVFKHVVYTWGGIRQLLGDKWEPPIRTTMAALEVNPDTLDFTLCGGRIASVSKLYAAMALDTWVIYDSRVAAAITYLLAATGHETNWGGHWGVLAAKNPKRLRMLPGFPRIYPGKKSFTNDLAFQSFVYASWMCQLLAEHLNQLQVKLPDGVEEEWKAFHVEMVLFMLGRDLLDHPQLP